MTTRKDMFPVLLLPASAPFSDQGAEVALEFLDGNRFYFRTEDAAEKLTETHGFQRVSPEEMARLRGHTSP